MALPRQAGTCTYFRWRTSLDGKLRRPVRRPRAGARRCAIGHVRMASWRKRHPPHYVGLSPFPKAHFSIDHSLYHGISTTKSSPCRGDGGEPSGGARRRRCYGSGDERRACHARRGGPGGPCGVMTGTRAGMSAGTWGRFLGRPPRKGGVRASRIASARNCVGAFGRPSSIPRPAR
jgi:hypothetical protein